MPSFRVLCLALLVFAAGRPATPAEAPASRTAWMKAARWGVMSHFLADWRARADQEPASVGHWNDLIDHFDVEGLASQLQSVGAGYYLLSIGQNSGYHLSPNKAYDQIVGIDPSKCSRRDLIADLATALDKRGIRLMVYLPSGAPGGDKVAREKLQWQNGPEIHPNREFQLKWEQVIREWSLRWGNKVAGWWFDGCYFPNAMYRSASAPNFASFAAAARAGNPQSAIGFNPGVVYRTMSLTPEEDYTAGEIDKPELWTPKRNAPDGTVDGVQIHVLTFLGERWGGGAPRFTSEQAVAFSQKVAGVGGVITWDTPLEKNGCFSPAYLAQLKAIGEAFAAKARAP